MLSAFRSFLNRPIAEDFRFKNQRWQSLQAGVYVFLFVYLFGGVPASPSRLGMLALFGAGCSVATLFANWVVPMLLPRWYDDDRWTVGKHIPHVLFILLCITGANQLILRLLHEAYPPFWRMYGMVTIIGFFPITVGVLVTEQRRLKRNLTHARSLNEQLTPALPIPNRTDETTIRPLVLLSDTGKDRLSLQPEQLIYIESVGNYVAVHWLHQANPQKTILRATLKDMEAALAPYPSFFRCHRAFLVNLNAVIHSEGNARGYQLTLAGTDTRIPVSRTYLDAFDAQIALVL